MAKSEYLQREQAAKKQLGAKGVKKRVKQLPTAARAFTREMTGIDVSRKGVKVDPFAVAMALPVGKVLKAANVLRAAGKASQAAALSARVLAKEGGRNLPKTINEAKRMFTGIPESYTPKTASKVLQGGLSRDASTSVFPRVGGTSATASSRLQKVADTITKRHYGDVAKKGVGHDVAVNMPRAKVLRNLKAKRGIQINKPR